MLFLQTVLCGKLYLYLFEQGSVIFFFCKKDQVVYNMDVILKKILILNITVIYHIRIVFKYI